MGALAVIREQFTFILTVLGVLAGLFLAAKGCERLCRLSFPRNARALALCAMCAALSGLMMLVEIPLFFAPEFYKLDFSELPVMLCTLSLGPAAGVVCEFLKVLIKLLLKGTTSAFVGEFANFLVGCALLLPASLLYHRKNRLLPALAVGVLSMTGFGSLLNAYYLLPKFCQLYGMPMEAILAMAQGVNPAIQSVSKLVLFAVVPFNLLKGFLISLLCLLLYPRLKPLLSREQRKNS